MENRPSRAIPWKAFFVFGLTHASRSASGRREVLSAQPSRREMTSAAWCKRALARAGSLTTDECRWAGERHRSVFGLGVEGAPRVASAEGRVRYP